MNNDLFVTLLVAALMALLGAFLGSYMALQPASSKIIRQADDISAQADNTLKAVSSEARRLSERLSNFKIEVPPVNVPTPEIHVSASISPWGAFWIFAATVSGIWLTNIFRKSALGKKIETRIVRRANGGSHDKKKRKRKRKT